MASQQGHCGFTEISHSSQSVPACFSDATELRLAGIDSNLITILLSDEDVDTLNQLGEGAKLQRVNTPNWLTDFVCPPLSRVARTADRMVGFRRLVRTRKQKRTVERTPACRTTWRCSVVQLDERQKHMV